MTNLKIIFTSFILIFGFFFNSTAQKKTPVEIRIDSLFKHWDSNESPGCALGIVKNGELIYAKGYGIADLEHDITITASTVFYIASVSKQFITMSILLLAEQGKLNLDDEIQKYLPDFPVYEATLTIRNFIHHTSGVRDYLTLWTLAGNDYMDHIDEEAVYQMIKRQKTLNFTPGEKYLYSNSCYFMLAMIVEKASGQSMKEFAHEYIFKPLKMKNSHFHDNYLHIVKNRAFSYKPNDKDFDNLIMRFDLVGSGGLYSNINDLYLWDQNFYKNKLGKGDPELLKIMHEEGLLNNGDSSGYAFALRNGKYRGLKTVSHGGSLAGYRSQLMRFPEQEFSVIILSNLASFKAKMMAQKVADVYLDDIMEPLEKESTLKESSKSEENISFEVANLNQYSGTYSSDELEVNYLIYMDSNALFVRVKNKKSVELKPIKIDTFTSNEIELLFTRDGKKNITGLMINAGRVQNLTFIKTN
jgi:CubicO group peptidase (beta-lactamase class C family)